MVGDVHMGSLRVQVGQSPFWGLQVSLNHFLSIEPAKKFVVCRPGSQLFQGTVPTRQLHDTFRGKELLCPWLSEQNWAQVCNPLSCPSLNRVFFADPKSDKKVSVKSYQSRFIVLCLLNGFFCARHPKTQNPPSWSLPGTAVPSEAVQAQQMSKCPPQLMGSMFRFF